MQNDTDFYFQNNKKIRSFQKKQQEQILIYVTNS